MSIDFHSERLIARVRSSDGSEEFERQLEVRFDPLARYDSAHRSRREPPHR